MSQQGVDFISHCLYAEFTYQLLSMCSSSFSLPFVDNVVVLGGLTSMYSMDIHTTFVFMESLMGNRSFLGGGKTGQGLPYLLVINPDGTIYFMQMAN